MAAAVTAMVVGACSAPVSQRDAASVVGLAPWGPCIMTESMPESDGSYPGVECSTLTVPFDYDKPQGPSFAVPVIRIPSKAAQPRLLVTNPGGPGISGVNDLRSNREYFEKFTDTYTVVSFDPRGVGGSKPAIRCLDDTQRRAIFDQPSVPASQADIDRAKDLAAGIGNACQAQFGDALAHVGTANVARDMDEIRKAMGFDQINYLGYSYGTFLGALYADMFPGKTDRIVLDSVMDPMLDYQEVRHGQAQGMQRSIAAFVDDCLRRADCPLTGPSDQALQQISGLVRNLDEQPYVGADGRRLSGARMLALVESSQYFPVSGWPSLRTTLQQALGGQWPKVLDAAYSPDLMVNPADSEYLSVVCTDFATHRNPDKPQRLAPVWAMESPISGANRAWSLQPCETWPAPSVRGPGPVDTTGAGPVLILSTTGDPATPLAWAQSLRSQIKASTLVVAPAQGHIASAQNTCAENTMLAFLNQGALPPGPVYTCPPNR
ncbi:alpha/beta hydrolase [Mycobacterium sp. NBC_00419]|uniref:alpha/beta hydrolase n=1 Tax=Mycobacterium sp. NBC_00419 TaxID=2975989 RepID=UPI002E20D1A4